MIWSSLACMSALKWVRAQFLILCTASLVSGPLAGTSAFSAKVATLPEEATSNNQHLICIYVPDVYERDGVTEVTLYFPQPCS
jgi:hypothetical protein